jgi:hypothetical protein
MVGMEMAHVNVMDVRGAIARRNQGLGRLHAAVYKHAPPILLDNEGLVKRFAGKGVAAADDMDLHKLLLLAFNGSTAFMAAQSFFSL